VTGSIGLLSGILIVINVIVGSGIFVNLHPLLVGLGSASFVAYLGAALFLLPVVYVLAMLAKHQPESGGLYLYATRYLGPTWGVVCGWSYFVGKSMSAGLMAHLLILVLKSYLPVLQIIPHLVLVGLFLLLLVALHVAGASLQGRMQWLFVVAKVVPVVFVVLLLFFSSPTQPFTTEFLHAKTFFSMLPLAVYAMIGFEVMCSVAHLIKNPEQTVTRIFMGGFFIVTMLLALFQFAAGLLCGTGVFSLGAFPAQHLLAVVSPHVSLPLIGAILVACVYTSIVGGTFGILTSNCWNMHRLASAGYFPGKNFLLFKTKSGVPLGSLLVEVALCLAGVLISERLVPLQKMSVLSVIFAFLCAMLAGLIAKRKDGKRLICPFITGAAVCSTTLLAGLTLYHIFVYGLSLPYILLFGGGLAIGIISSAGQKEA